MKFFPNLQRLAAALATVGLLLPSSLLAAPQASALRTSQASLIDVALQAEGTFHGRVVDASGRAQPGVEVALVQRQQAVASTTTDAEGQFAFSGVRGGVYEVTTLGGSEAVRLWAPRTAPPAAQNALLLTGGGDVVRAQLWGGLSNPWVLGGIVAAAIAIPLALSNDDDAS